MSRTRLCPLCSGTSRRFVRLLGHGDVMACRDCGSITPATASETMSHETRSAVYRTEKHQRDRDALAAFTQWTEEQLMARMIRERDDLVRQARLRGHP